jgi:hypothetical protein
VFNFRQRNDCPRITRIIAKDDLKKRGGNTADVFTPSGESSFFRDDSRNSRAKNSERKISVG